MKIRYIKFAALRVVKPFENDRVEVSIELDDNDDPDKAYDLARRFVYNKLHDREKRNQEETKMRTSREESIADRPLDIDYDDGPQPIQFDEFRRSRDSFAPPSMIPESPNYALPDDRRGRPKKR